MTYTLKGDRDTEYGWLRAQLPKGTGRVLDFGPEGKAPTVAFALQQGYRVDGVGLEPVTTAYDARFHPFQGDLLEADLPGPYDWVVNVSTIEHVGLAGRYGVVYPYKDGDLAAMARLRDLMHDNSHQVLVLPVGRDSVIAPWHRVYGTYRLPLLLRGYEVLAEQYWMKKRDDDSVYRPCLKANALNCPPVYGPPNYYAIGGLVLKKAALPTRHYCTYFDENYLDRGLALYESLRAHCQPFHLWICALSPACQDVLERLQLADVTIVPLAEIETPGLLAIKGTRTWQEYIWTLTPPWMLQVFQRGDMESLSYLDADTYFFSSPEPVYNELGTVSLGITPHRSSPHYRRYAKTNGLYNVGMVYARRDDTALACLHDWGRLCEDWCYLRVELGRYCDQKYLDDWPGKWGAWPIQHKGANLAPWNQGEAQYLYTVHNGRFFVDDDPLVWYHYHMRLNPWHPEPNQPDGYPIDPLIGRHVYEPYAQALERALLRVQGVPK